MGQFGYAGAFDPAAEVLWIPEGLTCTIALLSLDMPKGHTAACNACGATESPVSPGAIQWLQQMRNIKEVFVIRDCDKPGQEGAMWVTRPNGKKRPGWAPAIASFAPCVKNVVLPYPIAETHGKDVRDRIVEGLEAGRDRASIYAELLEYARSQPIVQGVPGLGPDDSEGDDGDDDDGEGVETDGDDDDGDGGDGDGDDKDGDGDEGGDDSKEPLQPIWEAEDDPHRLARVNLEQYRDKHDGQLIYWCSEWWKYRHGQYRKIEDKSLVAKVNGAIRIEFEERWRENEERRIATEAATGKTQKREPIRKVKGQLVKDVIGAMQSMVIKSDAIEMPCWLPDRSRPNFVSLKNGLLDLDALFAGKSDSEILRPHSPDWFSTVRLPYAFDPEAECSVWEKFLFDVFNGDQESIIALQMWFGYLLTQDTSLQKMMMVIGKTRSGKGTISRTISALLGRESICTPTLSSLTTPTELHGLVGKSLATINDARLSHRTDEVIVTERILSITGEDAQDIQRKHLTTMHSVKLAVRFMLFSNQLPALNDSSAALISRCLILVTPNSYVGNEDTELGLNIQKELPGILNWAIQGRQMLNEAKRITQPQSGQEMLEQLRAIVSPVSMFIDSQCIQKPDCEIETEEIFNAWCNWCLKNDISQKMTIQTFGRKIRDVIPGIGIYRPSDGEGGRPRKFIGICIKKNITENLSTSEINEKIRKEESELFDDSF